MHAATRMIRREMVFTVQPVPAERAEILGMVDYAVDAEALESKTKCLTDRILCNAPLCIAATKEQI